ncbi:MAG: copper resistance protein B [Pseudomonadota bacterium]
MKRPSLILVAGAAAFALAQPASAQMNMNMPGMKMPAPKKKAPPAKKAPAKKGAAKAKTGTSKTRPGTKAATARKTAPAKARTQKAAGQDMSNMPGMEMPANPPAGQSGASMPGMQMPGHDMSSMPGMQMPGMPAAEAAGTDLPAGNAPPPPPPADHAGDAVYGAPAMAMGREHLQTFHGGQKMFQLLNNIMEYQARKGRDGYEWDSQAWYGGDINRLWLKSEGEGASGIIERTEVQALYSRAIDPYFNLQGGVRYDFKPNPSRVYATLGVEGLAPNFFELEGALFLSNKGELMARAEGYYDQRITQRLILQPRVELNFAAQNSPEIGVGAGMSDAEIGLRLRYDIRREFAPYIGVQYQRAFGATGRYLREKGDSAGQLEFVAGVRTWF